MTRSDDEDKPLKTKDSFVYYYRTTAALFYCWLFVGSRFYLGVYRLYSAVTETGLFFFPDGVALDFSALDLVPARSYDDGIWPPL